MSTQWRLERFGATDFDHFNFLSFFFCDIMEEVAAPPVKVFLVQGNKNDIHSKKSCERRRIEQCVRPYREPPARQCPCAEAFSSHSWSGCALDFRAQIFMLFFVSSKVSSKSKFVVNSDVSSSWFVRKLLGLISWITELISPDWRFSLDSGLFKVQDEHQKDL